MIEENDELNAENMPPPSVEEIAELGRIKAKVYTSYDGVLGLLPDWVPKFHQDDFRRIREKLLNTAIHGEPLTAAQVIEWMDSHSVMTGSPSGVYQRVSVIPIKLHQDIGRLSFYRDVVALGKKKGLVLLAGEKAVKGEDFSSGGANKKGKEYEPKASIRKFSEQINSTEFSEMLNALKDADQCRDLYESTNNPIGVLFTGVDEESEVILYLPRGQLPDNQKQITFGRLRNILSEIKK